MEITKFFKEPKIIALIADSNQGKSNTIYAIADELKRNYNFNLVTYGLRKKIDGSTIINSVEELEDTKDSLIIVDEFFSLFDLDNRKIKVQIEQTIRLIFHNNNILLLSGLGENFKKFISAKVHVFLYKKLKICDLINGSRAKNIITSYTGEERGTTILNLSINELLAFDGQHYFKETIPYMREFDTKLNNKDIFENVKEKDVLKNVQQ